MCPALNDSKHVVVELAVVVSHCGVVEHADDVVEDLLDWNIRVFPCVDDTGSDVLENRGCDLAGGCVENIGEMILGQ
jgi:hypothetical protein